MSLARGERVAIAPPCAKAHRFAPNRVSRVPPNAMEPLSHVARDVAG